MRPVMLSDEVVSLLTKARVLKAKYHVIRVSHFHGSAPTTRATLMPGVASERITENHELDEKLRKNVETCLIKARPREASQKETYIALVSTKKGSVSFHAA